MQFVKVLHAFKKFEEFKRLGGGHLYLLQVGDARPLQGKMVSAQFYMPSHRADVISKCHRRKRPSGRSVPGDPAPNQRMNAASGSDYPVIGL